MATIRQHEIALAALREAHERTGATDRTTLVGAALVSLRDSNSGVGARLLAHVYDVVYEDELYDEAHR